MSQLDESVSPVSTQSSTANIESVRSTPRVSVLLYVKDSEQTLTRCLTSLSNQILNDLEIICIDDGSTDGSLDILKNYALKEPRIKLVELHDVGFGKSVNQGIKSAHGEYLSFLSPLDYVDPAAYIELFALAKKHDADLARASFYEQVEGSAKDLVYELASPEELDILINPAENTSIFYQPPAVWSTLYRRDYLLEKKLFFRNAKSNPYYFASFNLKTIVSTDKIVLTDKAYTHHSEHLPISTTLFTINDEYTEAEKFLKDKILWKTYAFIFEATKFAAYYRHMQTIRDKKQLEKFVLRTRAEFHDADNHRLLAKHYFIPKEHWHALKRILNFPPAVFLSTFKLRKKS